MFYHGFLSINIPSLPSASQSVLYKPQGSQSPIKESNLAFSWIFHSSFHFNPGHLSPSLALFPWLLISILNSSLVLLELTMNYIKRMVPLPWFPNNHQKKSHVVLKSHTQLGDVLPELPPLFSFSSVESVKVVTFYCHSCFLLTHIY